MSRVEAASGAKYSFQKEAPRKAEPIAPVGTNYTPIGRPDLNQLRSVPPPPAASKPAAASTGWKPPAAAASKPPSIPSAPRPAASFTGGGGTGAARGGAAPLRSEGVGVSKAPSGAWDDEAPPTSVAASQPPPPPPAAARPVPAAPAPVVESKVSTKPAEEDKIGPVVRAYPLFCYKCTI